MLKKIDGNNLTTTYTYDGNNRLLTKSAPSVSVSYAYDSVGNRISMTDKTGTTSYTYDRLNRLTSVTPSPLTGEGMGEGGVISYSYDPNGNRTKMITPEGKTTTYVYNKNNQLLSINYELQTTNYSYDPNGNQERVTYPNGIVSDYTYNSRNWLTSLINRKSSPLAGEEGGEGELLSSFAYTYDLVGNRTTVKEADGSVVTYAYDSLYRLTNEVRMGTQPYNYAYSYDSVGNRLTKEGVGLKEFYTYNENNQLTNRTVEYLAKELLPPGLKELPPGFSKGEKEGWEGKGYPPGWEKGKKKGWPEGVIPETYIISYSYDGNGNLIKEIKESEATNLKFTTTYKWDYENKLTMVSSPLAGEGRGEGSISYAYDGDGNRISKTDSSGTIKYINDIALPLVQVLQETDALGNLLASYTIGNDLVSRTTATETIYYHPDAIGSIRQLTDPAQTVIATYLYDAFGNLLAQTGTVVNLYLFTGEQQDLTTGLVYLRARYYDPSIGRFISRDPILQPMWVGGIWIWLSPKLVSRPQTLYPYVYCLNNPVNVTDPLGLQQEECPPPPPENPCERYARTGRGCMDCCDFLFAPTFPIERGTGLTPALRNCYLACPPGSE